jgi:actin-related protein 8
MVTKKTHESVCATFGAGVSSACVVDIGDQKVSVSCVEDGNSTKNTRYVVYMYMYNINNSY